MKPLIPHPAIEQVRAAYARQRRALEAKLWDLDHEEQVHLERICASIGKGHMWVDDHWMRPEVQVCANCGKKRAIWDAPE